MYNNLCLTKPRLSSLSMNCADNNRIENLHNVALDIAKCPHHTMQLVGPNISKEINCTDLVFEMNTYLSTVNNNLNYVLHVNNMVINIFPIPKSA